MSASSGAGVDVLAAWHLFRGFGHGPMTETNGQDAECMAQTGSTTLKLVPGPTSKTGRDSAPEMFPAADSGGIAAACHRL